VAGVIVQNSLTDVGDNCVLEGESSLW